MSVKGQRKKNSKRKWSQLVNSALRGSFITMDSVYACVHLRGVCVSQSILIACGLWTPRERGGQRFVRFGMVEEMKVHV